MAKVVVFKRVHPQCAGIDIGSAQLFVSTTGSDVVVYETFTADYHRLKRDLLEKGIKRVAMEATGVYWVALYEVLEAAGIQVCLVNPKETKQVKGRKTDVRDCQWIQKLFSAGLLHESFIPSGALKELRTLMRERQDAIEVGSLYVNKMQKCLELMNVKLTEVLAQVQGSSGIRMIQAIVQGQRDPAYLLSLCDRRIINQKSEQVLKALEGNYNETWVFLLGQHLGMWQLHQAQVGMLDQRIDALLLQLAKGKAPVEGAPKGKAIRHHPPAIEHLHQKLLTIYGVDVNCLPGINDYTLLRLLGEVGTDMSRFPTVRHFVSWCGLAPAVSKSGKFCRPVKIKNQSKAGQIFREAAQSIITSRYIAIGAFMRRLRSRKGPVIAVKAGARKIAEAFYNLLTQGTQYVEQGVKKYEEKLKQREINHLLHLAHKYKLQVLETQPLP